MILNIIKKYNILFLIFGIIFVQIKGSELGLTRTQQDLLTELENTKGENVKIDELIKKYAAKEIKTGKKIKIIYYKNSLNTYISDLLEINTQMLASAVISEQITNDKDLIQEASNKIFLILYNLNKDTISEESIKNTQSFFSLEPFQNIIEKYRKNLIEHKNQLPGNLVNRAIETLENKALSYIAEYINAEKMKQAEREKNIELEKLKKQQLKEKTTQIIEYFKQEEQKNLVSYIEKNEELMHLYNEKDSIFKELADDYQNYLNTPKQERSKLIWSDSVNNMRIKLQTKIIDLAYNQTSQEPTRFIASLYVPNIRWELFIFREKILMCLPTWYIKYMNIDLNNKPFCIDVLKYLLVNQIPFIQYNFPASRSYKTSASSPPDLSNNIIDLGRKLCDYYSNLSKWIKKTKIVDIYPFTKIFDVFEQEALKEDLNQDIINKTIKDFKTQFSENRFIHNARKYWGLIAAGILGLGIFSIYKYKQKK